MEAVARMQGEAREALIHAAAPELAETQRLALATLLGVQVTSAAAMGSAEIERLLQKKLGERLESGAASELAARWAPAVSSLFSAGVWGPGVSSLFSAAQLGLEVSSLFSALGAQWVPGVSSLFSGAAAAAVPGVSSLFSGAAAAAAPGVSSLFSAVVGAPGVGVPPSLIGLWGPGVSSLFSWAVGGASLFSGVGASWSAQPFGQQRERGFFMHVNAEVIFYGGTHPDAKVTIAGKPVELTPDGRFHYHFRFPDGDFDIPIVASAPDGQETRSATLSFKRATARTGEVGATAQPETLPQEPMGRKS
jgi:hypothetical protein